MTWIELVPSVVVLLVVVAAGGHVRMAARVAASTRRELDEARARVFELQTTIDYLRRELAELKGRHGGAYR